MSLRDQLQKAGLASKKQLKKANKSSRVEARKKVKAKKKGLDTEDEVTKKINEDMEARKEQDKQLNIQREKEKAEREQLWRAREIIMTRDLRQRWGDVVYRFVIKGSKIDSIIVTDEQQKQLAAGKLGIATTALGDENDYFLLKTEDCKFVKTIREDLVICLHPPRAEGEEEEEYVKHLIPRSALAIHRKRRYRRF